MSWQLGGCKKKSFFPPIYYGASRKIYVASWPTVISLMLSNSNWKFVGTVCYLLLNIGARMS